MKNLGIVITDGVGFRNFMLSDFLREAETTFDKVVIYSYLPEKVYEDFEMNAKVVELPVINDNFFTWFFLKLKEMAHLQLHKQGNFGIKDVIRTNKTKSRSIRGYAKRLVFLITSVCNSESWIKRFNRLQQRTFKSHHITKAYINMLKIHEVDFLFFTHQRPPYIAPLIYASEQLNIKNGTFIFSWDNLASKGRMAGDFNHYFVWSHLMATELLHFYKKIHSSQVHVVGTPQFEPYVLERYKTSKQEFFEKFRLNAEHQTICFSCGDVSTSKNDPLYIEVIAEAIQNGVLGAVNFIVRTSPAESPERFHFLKERYPFIIWNYPKWDLVRQDHQETWSQRVPDRVDVKDLRGILQYCDVFINMCSTMSLDAMCFDKPVINPVFGNAENGWYNDQRFLKFAHYKRVVESGAVAVVKTKEALIKEINNSLKNPEQRLQFQKKLLEMQVSCALKHTSQRIVNSIQLCLN
ncbi:hypothetical protein [Meridianimaribacter flavus]|uniref:UDP-glycosyltransferase n=1 Tax=Meridianimaribacter flavus TaxID=571115 RepID=A0ABY2G4P6_9FLAO|nr:hypothetical protein [Meridianimaribacter flavus]TDY11785.1 hypothetical protein A8975_1624 [Meridianimaribacter flavus]